MHKGMFAVATARQMELIDITGLVGKAVSETKVREGICIVYTPHTTSGLTINEGADPDVQRDLLSVFRELAPRDHPYRHAEGNSPAHVLASLLGSSVTIFIDDGGLQLGTWQKIFFGEFDGPRSRQVHWRVLAG